MHQLWQHRNGVWYVLHGPRLRKRISAQTKNRRAAEQFLARFIATADEPVGEIPTAGQVLAAYQADRETRVRSPNSLRFAVRGLAPLGDLFPSQLTPAAVRAWAKARGAAPGTVLREVGVLRAAMAWGVEHQWIPAAPVISNPVPAPPPRDRWITKAEAERLLAACREPHVRVFVMLGLMTVARSGAILAAKWGQVDWKRRMIDYGAGHGNKRRAIVPLNAEAFEMLKAAKRLACSDYIVEFRGDAVKSVRTGFREACRRAGLADVTPHILRHSGATWAVQEGIPLREVARMLGDSEATTERVYAKHAPEYLRRATGALQLAKKPKHKRLTGERR